MTTIESPKSGDGQPGSPKIPRSEVKAILSRYTHDEQRIILHNLETLSATAQYIGQDFEMRVLLNNPGAGWHWNFERNEVRVDPGTMLKSPIEVSKAIYCHEGLHRRITPKDGVPAAEWREPGLPFLVNSIEDPRIENFGGDAYPAYRPLRDASYLQHTAEASEEATAKLGRVPRHVQAGLEIIHQWFREAEGKPFEFPDTLNPDVKIFVENALPHAQDAWFRYPTRAEVDWQPEKIAPYFTDAYRIIREKIWPEFKKLYIRKAQVRDRIVHQAVSSVLNHLWEPRLIHDVYSARLGKGTHFGVNRLWLMLRKVSRNFTSSCWVLKCDIRKLYDSMDHAILLALIQQRVLDERAMRVVEAVVSSFHTEGRVGRGVPIGNVTSQIFTNIYLNELDQFVKQELGVKWYGRFSDDFVLVSPRRSGPLIWRNQVEDFLNSRLQLSLHPHKVSLRPLHQGIDFLGYVLLSYHRAVRSSTRRRMFRRLEHTAGEVFRGKAESGDLAQAVASYVGMLTHANTFELRRTIENAYSAQSGEISA